MMNIDFAGIERKWQKAWEEKKAFEVSENSGKEKFYVLEMFPYPSGAGLHMGHAWNYTIGDILARFKRMKGFEVLHPMGFDALGLPAENAAIKAGVHPEKYTNDAINNYIFQQKKLGLSYDWSRIVNSASPEYYKWDQWIFLKMLEEGLAYQKEASVNWCPKCDTVLANEQVENGKCWRHDDTDVEVKKLRQWFFRTTEYAEELLKGHEKIDWPERTVAMQKNWIGRSEGVEICFEVLGDGEKLSAEGAGGAEKKECLPDLGSSDENLNTHIKIIKDVSDSLDKNGIKIWFNGTFGVIGYYGKVFAKPEDIDCGVLEKDFEKAKSILEEMSFKKLEEKDNGLFKVASYDRNDIVLEIGTFDRDLGDNVGEIGGVKYSIPDASWLANCYRITSKKERRAGKNDLERAVFLESIDSKIKPRTLADSRGHGDKDVWKVFTTRPDTIFGVTFMVVAASHDRLDELVTDEQRGEVDEYLKRMNLVSEKDIETREKEGVFSGSYAINPANGEKVPIWIGNFVLADYGSGMVMGVPAHDKRDFDFANKYGIAVRQVVAPFICKNVDKNKETVNRLTAFGIVKNINTGEILCLDWKNIGWKAFPAGGVNEGEDVIEAVRREILEETGYKNLKFVRKIAGELYQHFYRPHKGNNVYSKNEAYYFELIDDEQDIVDAEEAEKHEAVWIDEDKVGDFVNVFGPEIIWKWYLNGDSAFTGEGVLCNSGEFDGMKNVEAKGKVTDWLAFRGIAKKVVNFKLRDWGVSRQRYWGTPIPVVYCDSCGVVPVPESELPVKLPKDVKFGEGNPLETNKEWLNATCPKCGKNGRRESDTMDTFVNSSWYFLRYCDANNNEKIFDFDKAKYWSPVDVYIGGAEHACMHLLYARFYTKFLRDIGMIDYDEPFVKLFHQGMLHAFDGRKMSKSLGNVILPESVSEKFGIDTARFFLSSLASPDKDIDWSDKGIVGAARFIRKVFEFYKEEKWRQKDNDSQKDVGKCGQDSEELLNKLNLLIKNLEKYYENFGYRKATIELREFFDLMFKGCSKETAGKFLKLFSPICPHISEELWEKLGILDCDKFISLAKWPKVNEEKILKKDEVYDINDKIIERVCEIVNASSRNDVLGEEVKEKDGDKKRWENVKGVYVYVMPVELAHICEEKILQGISGLDIGAENVRVFAVNDSEKFDPKGMAKKAKPGKAAVYFE